MRGLWTERERWRIVTVILTAFGVTALVVLFLWGPRWLAGRTPGATGLTPGERAVAEADARRDLLQALVWLGAAVGLVFTGSQLRQRSVQNSADLLLRAVEKLSGSDAESQLYGIHGLQRVADLSPADRHAAERILAEIVRERARRMASEDARIEQPAGLAVKTSAPQVRDRVFQAALEALGKPRGYPRQPLWLEGLYINQPEVDGLDFTRCCLRNARFVDGHLNGTSFRKHRSTTPRSQVSLPVPTSATLTCGVPRS